MAIEYPAGGSRPASLSKRDPTARASLAVLPAPTSAANNNTTPDTNAATAPPTPNQSAASRASGFMRVCVRTSRKWGRVVCSLSACEFVSVECEEVCVYTKWAMHGNGSFQFRA